MFQSRTEFGAILRAPRQAAARSREHETLALDAAPLQLPQVRRLPLLMIIVIILIVLEIVLLLVVVVVVAVVVVVVVVVVAAAVVVVVVVAAAES